MMERYFVWSPSNQEQSLKYVYSSFETTEESIFWTASPVYLRILLSVLQLWENISMPLSRSSDSVNLMMFNCSNGVQPIWEFHCIDPL